MNPGSLGGWDAAPVLLKALLYAATFVGAGGVFFLRVCGAELTAADRHRIGWLMGLALIIAVMLSGLRILVLAGSLSGHWSGMTDASLIGMILQTGERQAAALRVVGCVLAVGALTQARFAALPASIGAALAAASFATVGHAQALRVPAAAPLEALHLLCVAFWLGALLPLWMVAAHDEQGARIARAAQRFGRAAMVMVGLLALAGAVLAWWMLSGVRGVWSDDYARLLLLKLALVVILLLLAALNKLRITPRMLAGAPTAVRQLMRSMQAEMLLVSAILMTTAALTTLSGPPASDVSLFLQNPINSRPALSLFAGGYYDQRDWQSYTLRPRTYGSTVSWSDGHWP